ncbi:Beta-glucosidase 42 [Morella rubra]|uniref:Beta-glucosidase 42 n=1 Tax=Morella rubra TaxID=262757 RepID=A0A6A1UUP2_9ROSI|nr:Beta-glucosidase 42 [Morella rubra]
MAKKKDLFKEYEADDSNEREVSRNDFPPNFVFGVATSAYQVSVLADRLNLVVSSHFLFWLFSKNLSAFEGVVLIPHDPKCKIIDGSNADVAVDQYHRYKEDVELIAQFGFGAYRFSISWSRIFPDGLGTKVNEEGINYYNNLIDALLEKGIQPCVTLYHWDLPLHLHQTMGGWLNKQIVKYFAIYAETCFASFGDRVKTWITINEPLQTSVNGYDVGIFAPGRHQDSSTEPYLVSHHQILAHAAAFQIYQSKYKMSQISSTNGVATPEIHHIMKDKQGGQVGLVLDCEWAEAYSDKIEDKTAAARRLDFQFGCVCLSCAEKCVFASTMLWRLSPVMRERLGDRLPNFLEEDKELIRNSIDFVGLNHYTSRFIAHVSHAPEEGMDDEENDTSPVHEMLDDKLRVAFFKTYLAAVAQAIKDGVDVRGYFAWSLLDNFEWAQGYTKRFGLIYVDYKNELSRHPKSSAYWFLRFLKGGDGKNGKED